MRYAEQGFNLEIDLSRGNIERVATDLRDTEAHLGGLGTNAKILWDRVPPEVEPFSPDNLLIFSAGLLVGTAAPSANRTIVSTISPQTNLMAFSMAGGFFAAELKHAGYDKVILRGKSPDWVYLLIHNGKVELRDASHLQGKGCYETAELIKQELKEPKAQVASIGLAGENRVYFASIEVEKSSCSRLGVGAIMGDKRIKAVVVRGTKDVNVARPAEYFELCTEMLESMRHRLDNPLPGFDAMLATLGPQALSHSDDGFHIDNFAWGNARERKKGHWTKEYGEKWEADQLQSMERHISCFNCPVKCGGIIKHPTLGRFPMKCYSKLTYPMAAYADLDFGFRMIGIAQEHGVDGYTAPQVMAFAVELYEDGILTDEDMPGFPSDNEERHFWLMEKIVRREGIGEVLADGVYWAARRIGKGAEVYDHNTIKKNEQMFIKLGTLNPMYFLLYATGEKLTITQIEGGIPQAPLAPEDRKAYVKDWVQIPTGKEERFKQFVLEWGDEGKKAPFWPDTDLLNELVEWQEAMHYVDDATGVCAGVSSFMPKPPYHIHNYPDIISAATGIDFDEDSLWKLAARNRNLVRAINIRRGLKKEDERPPDDHWKKRFPEFEAELIDNYYKFKRWNDQGVPTKEYLHELDLDYVSEDLEQRGFLPSVGEAKA